MTGGIVDLTSHNVIIGVLGCLVGCLAQGCSESSSHSIINTAPITSIVGELGLGVAGNESVNGIRLQHQDRDPFTVGAWNFEHIMATRPDPRNQFTPREGQFLVHDVGAVGSAVLVRPGTSSPWGLEAREEFAIRDGGLDITITVRFLDPSLVGSQYVALFFANYVGYPEAPWVRHQGQWIQLTAPLQSTMPDGEPGIVFSGSWHLDLNQGTNNALVVDEPVLAGRLGELGFLMSLGVTTGYTRFHVMRWPSGDAWDFSWVLEVSTQPQVLRARMILEDWRSLDALLARIQPPAQSP